MNLTDIATLAQKYREPSTVPTDQGELMDLMSELSILRPKTLLNSGEETVVYIHHSLKTRTTDHGFLHVYLAEDLSTDEPFPWFILGLNKPYVKTGETYVPVHLGYWYIDGKTIDAVVMLPCKKITEAQEDNTNNQH